MYRCSKMTPSNTQALSNDTTTLEWHHHYCYIYSPRGVTCDHSFTFIDTALLNISLHHCGISTFLTSLSTMKGCDSKTGNLGRLSTSLMRHCTTKSLRWSEYDPEDGSEGGSPSTTLVSWSKTLFQCGKGNLPVASSMTEIPRDHTSDRTSKPSRPEGMVKYIEKHLVNDNTIIVSVFAKELNILQSLSINSQQNRI